MPSADSTKNIFRSASRFFSGTILSRCSGVVRDVSMAAAFGTGSQVSAFLVAYRFAHLLRRLFGEGAMQAAFIPLFETLRHENPGRAGRFFKQLMGALALAVTFIVVIAALALGAYLTWGHMPTSRAEVVTLTLIMMPSLLFICLYGLNASFLQCHHSYFIPGVSPVLFNLIWTVGIFYFWYSPEQDAMQGLAGFIILASIGQWCVTLPKTLTLLKSYPSNDLKQHSSDLKRIAKPMLLGTIGVAAAQINNFLDAVFARFASLEGPAYLWYSVRIEQLPLALFGIALSGALLPPLARAYKSGNMKQYRKFLHYALQRTSLFLIPISFAMILLSVTGITVVYARGDFGMDSVMGTTHCLWAYALGLWPLGMIQVLAPAYYARNNYRTPTRASVIAMTFNILLNSWFVFGLGLGAVSIALATSLAAWINLLILAIGLYQRGELDQLGAFFKTITIAFAAGIMGAITLMLDEQVYEAALSQTEILLEENLWHRLLDLFTQTALFSLGTAGTLFALKKHITR